MSWNETEKGNLARDLLAIRRLLEAILEQLRKLSALQGTTRD